MSPGKDISDGGMCLRPSKSLTLLLGGVLVLPALQAVILGLLLLRGLPRESGGATAAIRVEADNPPLSLSAKSPERVSGPWGTLEISEIVISPPRNVFMYDYGNEQARWVFPDCAHDQIENYLLELGIATDLVTQLIPVSSPDTESKGTVVCPSTELVWSLSPEARGMLYLRLAQFKENPTHREPFRFRSERFDEWFEGSGVSTPLVDSVRKLSYRHDGYWLFADLPLIWPLVDSPVAWTRFLQTLYQEQALALKLLVPKDEDTAALAAYWGGRGELPQLEPVLNTAKRRGDAVYAPFVLNRLKDVRSLYRFYGGVKMVVVRPRVAGT